jgi:hypothetical protein
MLNNNNQNKLYNQDNNINRRRVFPQDRQRGNNNNANIKFGQIPNPNQNANNFNRNNNNLNQNRTNNNNRPNDELGKAFLIIQRELKKKDAKIAELEKKIRELTNKLDSLTNNNNFNLSKNSPMATPFKEEPKNIYENNLNENNLYNMDYLNPNSKNNIRSNSQSRAYQMNQINNLNYNSDTENMIKKYQRYQGYDNLSHSNDNSVLTYNGVNANSKTEVKQYLKEVKAKIEPRKFKEFISNIKLLTSKREIAPNREAIIENMRILFGEEHKDLFLRFEKIIGAGR